MTYREYLTTTSKRMGAEASDVELILVEQKALIPDADVEVDVTRAKTALCRSFATMIPLANISEGGYSVSWNMEAVNRWYELTCDELGIAPATKPRLKNRSNLW